MFFFWLSRHRLYHDNMNQNIHENENLCDGSHEICGKSSERSNLPDARVEERRKDIGAQQQLDAAIFFFIYTFFITNEMWSLLFVGTKRKKKLMQLNSS